ncbi:CBS domain-containing protein [Actinospica sp. MGRD01-02]|uniref:CBS domain-containing protein n=1 Tax=Actinospica acidithermotolerans TaxID=2828514 RepID=A0A941EHR3_9ACTN|nr:CBS domain-containing protein [Actinospica acidithermotolerans]MBR7829329.1 CBS domain-containing protein [Actinospica acidithermotolerans]
MTTTQLLEAEAEAHVHVDTFADTDTGAYSLAAPEPDPTAELASAPSFAEPPEFAELTARDLMHRPDSPRHAVITGVALSPSDSIQICAQRLVDRDLDALPVLDDVTRHILGVVSLRDIARAAVDVPLPYHGVPRTGSAWHPERD